MKFELNMARYEFLRSTVNRRAPPGGNTRPSKDGCLPKSGTTVRLGNRVTELCAGTADIFGKEVAAVCC